MIWIDRNRVFDGKPIKPSANWCKRAKLKTDTAISEGMEHEVTSLYKDDEVKNALEKLFYDKCAYCETRPTPSNPWDVEHYRPKGRVAERPDDHPGYYWLAYTWENLFPSCLFCNQKRKDRPRYDDPVFLSAGGKLDQFPIEDETQRAMSHEDDISLERPLLLNPGLDDPEKHLTYDIQGQIHPKNRKDQMAAETIRICHLRRRRLRDDRARIVIRVRKIIRNIQLARKANNALAEKLLNEILDDYTAAEAIHAGVARAVQRNPDAFEPKPPT